MKHYYGIEGVTAVGAQRDADGEQRRSDEHRLRKLGHARKLLVRHDANDQHENGRRQDLKKKISRNSIQFPLQKAK